MKALCHPILLAAAFLIAAVVVVLAADGVGAGETVTVTVRGVRGLKGQLLASLFSSADGFPTKHELAMQNRRLSVTGQIERVAFTNVPPGFYAVAICHDENSDGRMNSRLFGRPKEGYALYRPADIKSGPPTFRGSQFAVGTNRVDAEVEMIYPAE